MTVACITGITGMVGSHLAEYILENTDWDVVGLIRWRSPLDNLQALYGELNRRNGRLRLVNGDLREAKTLEEFVRTAKPDYVFHLAAQSFPKTSFAEPNVTYDTNVNGTHRLLQAVKEFSPDAVVHVCSSSEVFGRVPKECLPISENVQFHPASPYAISKVGTDLVGRYFAEAFNLNTQITRMFTHTGPRRGDVFAESTFAKQIAMIEAGLIPNIVKVGNLDSLRTIADVRDAVAAYHKVVTINPVPGNTFNIGGQTVKKVGEILEFLIDISQVSDIEIVVDKERLRPIDADLQIPDVKKFKMHTGWEPKFSFETTMNDLLNYWRHKILAGDIGVVR